MLDHADRSRYTQRDEVILRFRSAQDLYDSTRCLVKSFNSGRPGAVGVREHLAEQTFRAVWVNLETKDQAAELAVNDHVTCLVVWIHWECGLVGGGAERCREKQQRDQRQNRAFR